MTYYEAVKAALAVADVPVYHFKALKQDSTYIVWSETDTDGLHADNAIKNWSQRIAVDIFTKAEYSTIHKAVVVALEAVGFAVSADINTDYEEDTGYIHHAITATWE